MEGSKYNVFFYTKGGAPDDLLVDDWTGEDAIAGDLETYKQAILRLGYGSITAAFTDQYIKFTGTTPDFYEHVVSSAGPSFFRRMVVREENDETKITIGQLGGGFKNVQTYTGLSMQADKEKPMVSLEARRVVLKPQDSDYFIETDIVPKGDTIKATSLGTILDGKKEVYQLDQDLLSQLRLDQYVLMSLYRIKEGIVEFGHGALSFWNDLPRVEACRGIPGGVDAFSVFSKEDRPENWFGTVKEYAEEAIFRPKEQNLLDSVERIKPWPRYRKYIWMILLASTIAFSYLTILHDLKFSLWTLQSIPVWPICAVTSVVLLGMYSIFLYREYRATEAIVFQPGRYCAADEIHVGNIHLVPRGRLTRKNSKVYLDEDADYGKGQTTEL